MFATGYVIYCDGLIMFYVHYIVVNVNEFVIQKILYNIVFSPYIFANLPNILITAMTESYGNVLIERVNARYMYVIFKMESIL